MFQKRLSKIKIITFILSVFLIILLNETILHKIHLGGGFYIYNQGISLGIKIPNYVWFFGFFFFLATLSLLFYYFLKNKTDLIFLVAIILFFGGSFSNFFERFFYQGVFDYLRLNYSHLPVFNFADVEIFIGALLLLSLLLKNKAIKCG